MCRMWLALAVLVASLPGAVAGNATSTPTPTPTAPEGPGTTPPPTGLEDKAGPSTMMWAVVGGGSLLFWFGMCIICKIIRTDRNTGDARLIAVSNGYEVRPDYMTSSPCCSPQSAKSTFSSSSRGAV
eukprot:TRINITY_DN4131_c0_g1_i7.p3 TRINITY_DN4131_c0_g1~~TRINITY_DN4131_c0_g1_i7.p3  ORF type:complete len:127 (+),score=18.38 TRINITY_DN4131_c0_g1_i7:61-441(+)